MCQSGFYIDFFVKKIAEVFIKNVFIYAAFFFGEKFEIEILTKKNFKVTIAKLQLFLKWVNLNHDVFFTQLVSWIFYLQVGVLVQTTI